MTESTTPEGKSPPVVFRGSVNHGSPSKQSDYMKSISQLENQFVHSQTQRLVTPETTNFDNESFSVTPTPNIRNGSVRSSLHRKPPPQHLVISNSFCDHDDDEQEDGSEISDTPLVFHGPSSPIINDRAGPLSFPPLRSASKSSVSSARKRPPLASIAHISAPVSSPNTPTLLSPSSPLYGSRNLTESLRNTVRKPIERDTYVYTNSEASESGSESPIMNFQGRNLQKSLTEASTTQSSPSRSLFSSVATSPITAKYKNNRESISSISASSVFGGSGLPLDIKIMVDSRPASIHHNFDGFEGKTYKAFWMLSDQEAETFREWNSLEFERQSRLFEYFMNLQRIRFNLKRMVYHYGEAFKKTSRLTADQESDYRKTFVPITAFYGYVDRLVTRKLKPAYEGKMFVNDRYVFDVSFRWLTKLAEKYRYISRSVVYLARLSSNDKVRDWITKEEESDQLALSNRFAPSAKELFSSYFIKLFTPLALIFKDLAKLYGKMGKIERQKQVLQLQDLIAKINITSDYTTDLDNKISLNESVLCADYLYLQTVNLFDKDRHLKPGFMELELKRGVSWVKCKLVLCDNYLLPLLEKKHRDTSLFLAQPPIAFQYLSYHVNDPEEEGDPFVLTLKDFGNEITYTFRTMKEQQMASIVLSSFTKELNTFRNKLFTKLSRTYKLKLVNGHSFTTQEMPDPSYPALFGPEETDLVLTGIKNQLPVKISPLSVAEPFGAGYIKSGNDNLCAVCSNDGIYLGNEDSPESWRKVCRLSHVRQIDIVENDLLLCLSGDKLYECRISNLMGAYNQKRVADHSFKEIQKHCKGYAIGCQEQRQGPLIVNSRYVFTWKDRKIKYSPLIADNGWKCSFRSMKATFEVRRVCILYPNHFTIMHYAEDSPIFYLSNLSSLTNTPLPKIDEDSEIRIRQKGQKPIKTFVLAGERQKDYEVLLVYTRYCITVAYNSITGFFRQSRPEIMLLNFECEDAAFDSQDKVLFICGKKSVESWKIPPRDEVRSEKDARPELVGCIIGDGMRLLCDKAGQITVSMIIPTGSAGTGSYRKVLRVEKK